MVKYLYIIYLIPLVIQITNIIMMNFGCISKLEQYQFAHIIQSVGFCIEDDLFLLNEYKTQDISFSLKPYENRPFEV